MTSSHRIHRVSVRSAQHYNVMRLEEGVTPISSSKRLSPAALWILIAYIPRRMRSRPWVRHLVHQQLATVAQRPLLEREQIATALCTISEPVRPRVAS